MDKKNTNANSVENIYRADFCPGHLSSNATGTIPKIKYQNNNNNLQENSSNVPQKINGYSDDSGGGGGVVAQTTTNGRQYSQNIILQNNFHLNGELAGSKSVTKGDEKPRPESRHSSSSGSFDNLSLNSENGLIEEIILLPSNAFSEDEISLNSDDCVYAYRGADVQNMVENHPHNDEQDDETDFLEMDFDPEPNSEVENENDRQNDDGLPMNVDYNGEFYYEPNKSASNDEEADQQAQPDEAHNMTNGRANSSPIPMAKPPVRNTGAKPKILSSSKTSTATKYPQPDSSKSSSLTVTTAPAGQPCSSRQASSYINQTTDDDHCLECTENEFLLQNKQNYAVSLHKKQCGTCGKKFATSSIKRPNESVTVVPPSQLLMATVEAAAAAATTPSVALERMNFSFSEDNLMERERKSNESEEDKRFFNLCASKTFSSFSVELNDVMLDKKKKKMQSSVTIYSVNCDERTIVEALELIGIKPNVDTIRQHFEEVESKNTTTMLIPEYILYLSKRHCDYKKIMEVIRAACPGEHIDLSFCPLEVFAAGPDIIQVHPSQIASHWTPDTDLREILAFKNRHFHRLNILGKIVNFIRQPITSPQSDVLLSIPQYYRSGYINIIRKL